MKVLLLFTFASKSPSLNSIIRTLSFSALLVLAISSCNKSLMTVLVEDPNGNVELIYAGVQSPENLVKEIRYFPNGDTLMITPMKKGAVHGAVTSFHKDNLRKEEVTFEKGKQNGSYKRFDTDGILVFEGIMVDGMKHGTWTTWYDDVQIAEQRSYVNDQPNGKWTYWYIDGHVRREEVYDLGKLIDKTDFE